MKITLNLVRLLCAVLIVATQLPAHAVSFEFSDTTYGTVSGALNITKGSNEITATLNNTSPIYAPAITGFGFSTSPDVTISGWRLEAYNEDDELIRIDETIDLSYYSGSFDGWKLDTNFNPRSGLGIFLEWFPETEAGVKGGLYNPSVTSGFGGPPQFFTTSTLTLMLAPTLVDEMLTYSDPYTRWQNVGSDGQKSLKLVGTPGNGDVGSPVPEPATLLLVGSGLIGLVGYSRKKSKKK